MRFDDRPADRQAHPQTAMLRRVESLEHAVRTENLTPEVVVMETAEDGERF